MNGFAATFAAEIADARPMLLPRDVRFSSAAAGEINDRLGDVGHTREYAPFGMSR
jgi:hypothetical protein